MSWMELKLNETVMPRLYIFYSQGRSLTPIANSSRCHAIRACVRLVSVVSCLPQASVSDWFCLITMHVTNISGRSRPRLFNALSSYSPDGTRGSDRMSL